MARIGTGLRSELKSAVEIDTGETTIFPHSPGEWVADSEAYRAPATIDRDHDRTARANGRRYPVLSSRCTFGAVITALIAGTFATLGLRASLPWNPSEPELEHPTRLYVLAGYSYAVLRDVFAEGRGSTAGATRRPFVGEAAVEMGYRQRTFKIEYRHVVRGREYHPQPSSHSYGSLTFTRHRF